MNSILLTAIGGDIAQSIATIIREVYPNWRIIGCDINDRHAGFLFVDKYYTVPIAGSTDYLSKIKSIVKKEKIDFVFPLSEPELIYFMELGIKEIFDSQLIKANNRSIELGTDKLLTSHFLSSIGCPAPWTISANECDNNTQFPCIFKPRRGSGSKKVFICNNIKEAIFFNKKYPDCIVQELLLPEEQEITCAIYRTLDGRIAVLQLLRKLLDGSTAWAKVIQNKEIFYQCKSIALGLDLKGSINVQLRVTNQGPRVFEINPRFSSTVLIRHLMGYCDVVWALKESMGHELGLLDRKSVV